WRDPRKGLRVLLAAFQRLRSEGLAVTLDVIGKGGDSSRPAIPGVHFLGVVESEAVLARHVSECDVFVSPATGQESFGIVLLGADRRAPRGPHAASGPGPRTTARCFVPERDYTVPVMYCVR